MFKLAEMFSLAKVEWQFFGTLTFREPFLRARESGKGGYQRFCKFQKFGRLLSASLNYSERNWERLNVNCLRLEPGEIGGLWHYHFLMAGLPVQTVNRGTCKFLEHVWRELCRGGFCKIRVFDTQQNGVAYISKCLDPRDKYEFNKFGLAQSLTFSPSCVSAIRRTVVKPRLWRRLIQKTGMQRFATASVPAQSGTKDCESKLCVKVKDMLSPALPDGQMA